MPVLNLDYRCCDRMRPLFLKHAVVEEIAGQARRQLVDADADALPIDVLKSIEGLKINGLTFDLWIDTDHPVNDEQGQPVLGVCEFDPAASTEAALLSVTPVSESASAELVLSTFGHELGHAVFDAPGWVATAIQGPGLFDDPGECLCKAYRTTTRDAEHLAKTCAAPDNETHGSGYTSRDAERAVYFAELRANEFMGSLLVPRQRLALAALELAPQHEVTVHDGPSFYPEAPGNALRLTANGAFGFFNMECLQKALAKRFGVNRRFIEVRMERYGFYQSSTQRH